MDDLRGTRGEYNWWKSFTDGHPDLEDSLLSAAVDAERLGEVKAVEEKPKPRTITVQTPNGPTEVEIPAVIPPEGAPITVNGTKGIAYQEPAGGDADTDEENEAKVEAAIRKIVDMRVQLVQYNGRGGLYGFALGNSLRDDILDAWEHVEGHECEDSKVFLFQRILGQVIEAIKLGMTKTGEKG